MKKEVVEILERPLPIKTRGDRLKYNYVDGDDIRRRLNEAFSFNWSSRVLKFECNPNEGALVHISISCEDGDSVVEHQGFGYAPQRKSRDGENVLTSGDLLKSAHTNAIKDAAKNLNLGLIDEEGALEYKRVSSREVPASKPVDVEEPKDREVKPKVSNQEFKPIKTTPGVVANGSGEQPKQWELKKISQFQLLSLNNMVGKSGMDESAFIKEVLGDSFEVEKIEALNMGQASKLINYWRNKK